MELREIGQSGLMAAPIALGTWAIGGGSWWGESDDAESVKVIQYALDEGIQLIDTAPVYGFGHSERVVGQALQGRRDKALVATKCGLWWQDARGSKFFELEGKRVTRCLRPETIQIELEDSLRRMNTDYIDLMQTHWQSVDPDKTPIEDTMACLMKLQDQGKIRAIGVSNATPEDMEGYRAVGDIVSNQPRYSLLDREIEKTLLPYCIENQVSTLVYSPLEQGILTGKIGMGYEATEGEFRNNLPWFKPANRQRVLAMLNGWKGLTDKYDCSLAQLCIAWTIAQPGITFALCGARKLTHVRENAAAGRLALDAVDMAKMRADALALGQPE